MASAFFWLGAALLASAPQSAEAGAAAAVCGRGHDGLRLDAGDVFAASFAKQESTRLFGQPTYWTLDMAWQPMHEFGDPSVMKSNAADNLVGTGFFLYFCGSEGRWVVARNGCDKFGGETDKDPCLLTTFQRLLDEEAAGAEARSCPYVASAEQSGEALNLGPAAWLWHDSICGLSGTKVFLGHSVAGAALCVVLGLYFSHCLSQRAPSAVCTGIAIVYLLWCGVHLSRCWPSGLFQTSDVQVEISRLAPCAVVPNETISFSGSTVVEPFCLGGWGEPKETGVCSPGFVQRPQPLICEDGKLNAEEVHCGFFPELGDLLNLDELPPFYFIFFTSIVKMMATIYALGPPRPGVRVVPGTAKAHFKRAVQMAVLVSAVAGVVADVARASHLAYLGLDPEEIRGLPTYLGHLSPLARALGIVALSLCTSGFIGNIASAVALGSIYQYRCKLLFAHEGERRLEEARTSGAPLAREKLHGIDNAFALAGHTSTDFLNALDSQEGPIVARYIRFVYACAPLYLVLLAGWCLVGGVAYFWFVWPFGRMVLKISDSLVGWTIATSERRLAGKDDDLSRERDADIAPLNDEDSFKPLTDPEAIYYLMLEWCHRFAVETTRPVSVTFTPSVTKNSAQVSTKNLPVGFRCDATAPLTYRLLCGQSVEVAWSEDRDKDFSSDTDDGLTAVIARIPRESLKAVYSAGEAGRDYEALLRAFRATGTSEEAWITYFCAALFVPLAVAGTCTLAVRLVVFSMAWPPVEGKANWDFGTCYFSGLLTTFGERHLAQYARVTAEALLAHASKGVGAWQRAVHAATTLGRALNLVV